MELRKGKTFEHVRECGGCFFCLNKCPQCGSTDIEVEATIRIGWSNDSLDEIHLEADDDPHAHISCRSCDNWQKSRGLGYHITRMLEFPYKITIDEKGKNTPYFLPITDSE